MSTGKRQSAFLMEGNGALGTLPVHQMLYRKHRELGAEKSDPKANDIDASLPTPEYGRGNQRDCQRGFLVSKEPGPEKKSGDLGIAIHGKKVDQPYVRGNDRVRCPQVLHQ